MSKPSWTPEPGEAVAIVSGYYTRDNITVATVERHTPTQVVLKGRSERYRARGGKWAQVGWKGGSPVPRLAPLNDPEVIRSRVLREFESLKYAISRVDPRDGGIEHAMSRIRRLTDKVSLRIEAIQAGRAGRAGGEDDA